jgi:hypothetical protein
MNGYILKKLTFSLHFLSFFIISIFYLSCIFLYILLIHHGFFNEVKKNQLKVDMHMCHNMVRWEKFQNTWTKAYHVSKFMGSVKESLFQSKNNNMLLTYNVCNTFHNMFNLLP